MCCGFVFHTSTPSYAQTVATYTDRGRPEGMSGTILCMRPTNGRRRYIVTSSLIGWAHTETTPGMCIILHIIDAWVWRFQFCRIYTHLQCHRNIMAFQITRNSTLCSTDSSGKQQRKHQNSVLLVICERNSSLIPHTNGQQRGAPFHVMTSLCTQTVH